MADDANRDRPQNLRDEDVSLTRNRQRNAGVDPRQAMPPGAEETTTQEKVWSDPGGEAHAYRASSTGAGGDASGHGDLTARETPETTRKLRGED